MAHATVKSSQADSFLECSVARFWFRNDLDFRPKSLNQN